MKSKELEVLTRNGKEITNKMINLNATTEEYRIEKAKFNFLLKLMDELAKVD